MLGENYGRKLLHGVMKVKGINVGKRKIGTILKEMNPEAQMMRQNVANYLLNQKVCNAKYFGDKIHSDQNEKLEMFGVAHVCARDRFSGKIVGHTINSNDSTFLMVRVLQKITEMILLKYP